MGKNNNHLLALIVAALVVTGAGSTIYVYADEQESQTVLENAETSISGEEETEDDNGEDGSSQGNNDGEESAQDNVSSESESSDTQSSEDTSSDASSVSSGDSSSTNEPGASSSEASSELSSSEESISAVTVNMVGQALDIPDENFRKALVSTLNLGDRSGDSYYLYESDLPLLSTVSSLNLNPSNKIKDLTGIQYFTSLTSLNVQNQELKSVDLSGLSQLVSLNLCQNQLVSVDLTGCSNLKSATLYANQLKTLHTDDLISLTDLDICSNQLESLDLSNNTNLTYLCVMGNRLKTLDLSNNPSVTRSTLTRQSAEAGIRQKDGMWIVDMNKVVGAENIGRVTLATSDGSYDPATGLAVFQTQKNSMSYTYDCLSAQNHSLQVTLSLTPVLVETYTIKFCVEGNGTIDGTNEVIHALDDGTAFPQIPQPAPGSSSRFVGWYDANGQRVHTFPQIVNGNMVFTAKFMPVSSGGSGGDSGSGGSSGGNSGSGGSTSNPPKQTVKPDAPKQDPAPMPETPVPEEVAEVPAELPAATETAGGGNNAGASGNGSGSSDSVQGLEEEPKEEPDFKIFIDNMNVNLSIGGISEYKVNSVVAGSYKTHTQAEVGVGADTAFSVQTDGPFASSNPENKIGKSVVRGLLAVTTILGLVNLIRKKFFA